MKHLAILATVAALVGAGTAGATTITFDGISSPGNNFSILQGPLETDGFLFTAVDGNDPDLATPQTGSTFYNGSDALGASNTGNILMTRIGGGTFTVLSLDLDRLFAQAPLFEIQADGGSIVQTFDADNTLGNETMTLNGFTNITSLLLGAGGTTNFANLGTVDNIVVEMPAVPLPASLPLILGAFGVLGLVRRRPTAT